MKHARVLCLLLAFASSALAPAAWARNWRIADYRDTIGIAADGSAVISERLDLVFAGEYHGIHRIIPVEYPGPRGSNYTLFLSVTSVTDGSGRTLKYDSSYKNGFRDLKIYIPDAVDADRTVLINYVVKNPVRFFEDHDEFYWNVTGNDWPVPIDHASAFVNFPAAASGSLRAQAFTGVYGSSKADATSDVNGASVEFETANPLSMRGGLTIDVYLPKGILQEPGPLTRLFWFLQSNLIVLLPLWALAVMGTIWFYRGRDPDPGVSVAPMYEPPKGMTPAEAGTLVDDSLDPRDITCTLIDLAVRGYVKIEETQEKVFLFTHKDYLFHLVKPRSEWKGLAPHESVLLENIFSGGELTTLSSLKNRFYTAIPTIKQDVFNALRGKGLYAVDPESAGMYTLGGIALTIAPFALLYFLGGAAMFNAPVLVVICGALAAVPVVLFGRKMTCKTREGARTRVAVLGFQEFMNRVDADRLQRMPPDTFEKYLPFAMALGVEHHWAQAFQGLIHNPPSWYVSPNPMSSFNPVFFSNSMSSMASDVHEVFVSAPRASSSGSGFSGGGGGFSGGGFGGGGGSAF
jgi:uncharacterized membrane protein